MGEPLRTCLACRRTAGKSRLVRLVVAGPAVQVDHDASSPGRGAYLCGDPGCTRKALRRDGAAIRRALRVRGAEIRIDGESLAGDVQQWLGSDGVGSPPQRA